VNEYRHRIAISRDDAQPQRHAASRLAIVRRRAGGRRGPGPGRRSRGGIPGLG
jgi:hypothetical protein